LIPNFIFNVDENINSTDIANHFKILHGDKFIYQNDKLYCFNGIYWKAEEKNKLITLNNFLSNVYYFDIIKLVQNYSNEIAENNEIEKELKMTKLNKILKFQNHY
jgi:hypothetical protein